MVLTSCVAAVASEWSIPFTHDQTVLLCLESCTLWMEWVTLRRKHITLLEGRGHLLRHHRSQVMMWAWQICCLYTLAVYHREWNIPEADSLVSLFYLLESESESHSVLSNSLWPHGLYHSWNSPGQNTGVSSHSLFQGIFSIPSIFSRDWTQVSCITGKFFTIWASREAHTACYSENCCCCCWFSRCCHP